jgi:MFS family permease
MYHNYQRAYVLIKSMEGISMSWSNATYVFFILSLGYPLWVVMAANMVFMLMYTLLDPYTGHLGDKYGQRVIYVLGTLFWGAGMFIYSISLNPLGFILAETAAAFGRAFTSEALESWLHNSMPDCDTTQIRARGDTWMRLAGIPAAAIGGIVGSRFGFQWPWLIAAMSCAVFAIVMVYLLRPFPKPAYRFHHVEVPPLRQSIRETRYNPYLAFSFIFMAVTAFAFQPLNMYWPQVLKNASGGRDWWQGFAWIVVALGLAWGAKLTAKLQHVSKRYLNWILVSIGIAAVISSWAASNNLALVALVFFAVSEVPRGAIKNALFTFCNSHIRDENRSTMNSIRSAAVPLGSFFGLFFFAVFSVIIPQPEIAWIVSGIILICFSVYVQSQKFS